MPYALIDQTTLYKGIIKELPLPVVIVTEGSRQLECNDKAQQLLKANANKLPDPLQNLFLLLFDKLMAALETSITTVEAVELSNDKILVLHMEEKLLYDPGCNQHWGIFICTSSEQVTTDYLKSLGFHQEELPEIACFLKG